MQVHFLPPARNEFDNAIAYYNQTKAGLGFEFAEEVQRTIGRIMQFPEAWPLLSARARRSRLNRFPYGVLYQVRDDALLIVAVMHLHREPSTWKARLASS